jgi:hypothetical protein
VTKIQAAAKDGLCSGIEFTHPTPCDGAGHPQAVAVMERVLDPRSTAFAMPREHAQQQPSRGRPPSLDEFDLVLN